MIRFLVPFALILLPISLIWTIFHWRNIRGLSKSRRIWVILLRTFILTCLSLALSQIEWRLPSKGNSVIFVLDQSDSVGQETKKAHQDFIRRALQNMGSDDQAGIIVFGKEAMIEAPVSSKLVFTESISKTDKTGSNLAGALRLALASFPAGKSRRIVVLSDGLQTSGDASSVAYEMGEEGVPIDYVWVEDKSSQAEVSVVGLQSPSQVVKNQTFNLKVQFNSRYPGKGTLSIERNGELIRTQKVEYPGGISSVLVPQTLETEGMNRYRAMLTPDGDLDKRNNLATGFVRVQGQTRVLVLQQNPADRTLFNALIAQGIAAELRGPDRIPNKIEELQNYDLLILNDINAIGFLPAQMRMIETAVQDTGIGLMMIGGEHSFLPGGWYQTPVANILPVDLNIRQRRVTTSASVLIIADMSGSMSVEEDGFPKFKLAASAARRTVDLLSPFDKLGVAGSDNQINYVAPMQELKDKKYIKGQIDTLTVGGGGIYMKPSIEFGAEKLRLERTKVRHMIILADGNDADDQEGCELLARQLKKEKITMSVISIGKGQHTAFLRDLAKAGGGRFYLADTASKLPAIFTQDTAIVSRSAIEEGVFTPKVSLSEESLQGFSGVPRLYGYCISEPQPWARVGMRSDKDDVLLARGQAGLGSTFAFTSDAEPRWAKDWTAWSGYSKFWAQAVRSTVRRATNDNIELNTVVEGGKGVVNITSNETDMNSPPPKIKLLKPDGSSEILAVRSTGAGEYIGEFDASQYGSYVASAADENNSVSAISGFSVSYPPEYSQVRADESLLKEVSEIAKGRKITDPRQAYDTGAKPTSAFQPISFFLVIIALLLLPFDIGLRRITINAKELIQWITRRQVSEAPTQRLGALKDLRNKKQSEVTEVSEEYRQRIADLNAQVKAQATQSQASKNQDSTLGEVINDDLAKDQPAASNPITAGQSLLEAKRRREEERQKAKDDLK